MKSGHFLWLAVLVVAGVYLANQVDNYITNNSAA
jgi:hypothetical protein